MSQIPINVFKDESFLYSWWNYFQRLICIILIFLTHCCIIERMDEIKKNNDQNCILYAQYPMVVWIMQLSLSPNIKRIKGGKYFPTGNVQVLILGSLVSGRFSLSKVSSIWIHSRILNLF